MGTIMTIRGETEGEDLGIVDYHEHLCFDAPPWLLREDPDFRLNDVEKSAQELRSWVDAGGKTIIEMFQQPLFVDYTIHQHPDCQVFPIQ